MVADGVNGWSLEDYTWDPKTGVGTYTYERVSTGCFADAPKTRTETRVVKKAQPYHPSHTGWFMISRFV